VALAEAALKERNLATTDENIFLVASAIVPGKNMELNEGIKFLTGRAKISLPLLKKVEAAPAAAPASGSAPMPAGPFTTTCTVVEGGSTRTFRVTIESPQAGASAPAATAGAAPAPGGQTTPVFSPFDGKVELVEINVKVGDHVSKGQVVAAVEAMKAKHDVRSPVDGKVTAIHAALGAEVTSGHPILTIGS